MREKKDLDSTKSTLTSGKCVQIGQIQERGLSEEQYNETRIQIGTHRIQFQYRGEIIGQPRLDRSIQLNMCSLNHVSSLWWVMFRDRMKGTAL